MPKSYASKKIEIHVSVSPATNNRLTAIAASFDLSIQETARTAIDRGLAALADDLATIENLEVARLTKAEVLQRLRNAGLSDEEIEQLTA